MAFKTNSRQTKTDQYSRYPRMNNSHTRGAGALRSAPNSFKLMFGFVAGFVVLVFLAVIITPIVGGILTTSTQQNCVVTEKSTAVSDGESQYRVHTENCGTFSIEDSLLDTRFDTADMYGAIQNGETYDFSTRGKRVGFLSMFPNIIEATPSK